MSQSKLQTLRNYLMVLLEESQNLFNIGDWDRREITEQIISEVREEIDDLTSIGASRLVIG